jgi:hypothetical protein
LEASWQITATAPPHFSYPRLTFIVRPQIPDLSNILFYAALAFLPVDGEISGLADPLTDTFTMSSYGSFITEFGLVTMTLLVILIIGGAITSHNWNRHTFCWLILTAYWYVQFEGYRYTI